jgi:hypothetical protein
LFESYITEVIIVSLAIYGLWNVFRDGWRVYLLARWRAPLRSSFLVVVRNVEQQVEYMVRYFLQEFADDDTCEIIVADCGSDDITPLVLDRLASDHPALKVVHLAADARPVTDSMPFCQGDIVHVLDFVNRLNCEDFAAAVHRVIKSM